MAVDLRRTRLGEMLQKTLLLNEAVAWVESIDINLQNKIVREWVQQDQLIGRGVDEYGEIIGFYSAATEQLTGGLKKEGEPFTLFDSGDFFRSMFVTVLADEIIINAEFAKMQDQKWWREQILGLTDENLTKFIEAVRKGFQNHARRILGIN